ncbi:hypothetical protein M3J09_005410 [Ascochyta lentis]
MYPDIFIDYIKPVRQPVTTCLCTVHRNGQDFPTGFVSIRNNSEKFQTVPRSSQFHIFHHPSDSSPTPLNSKTNTPPWPPPPQLSNPSSKPTSSASLAPSLSRNHALPRTPRTALLSPTNTAREKNLNLELALFVSVFVQAFTLSPVTCCEMKVIDWRNGLLLLFGQGGMADCGVAYAY